MLGRPARLDYADWFGAHTGVSAGDVVAQSKGWEARGGGLLLFTTGGTGGRRSSPVGLRGWRPTKERTRGLSGRGGMGGGPQS